MDLPVFPIFALKVRHTYVIAAGGGGDPLYGKKNGIVVYDLTTYVGLCYCETDDIIDRIEVWDTVNLPVGFEKVCAMSDDGNCDSDLSSVKGTHDAHVNNDNKDIIDNKVSNDNINIDDTKVINDCNISMDTIVTSDTEVCNDNLNGIDLGLDKKKEAKDKNKDAKTKNNSNKTKTVNKNNTNRCKSMNNNESLIIDKNDDNNNNELKDITTNKNSKVNRNNINNTKNKTNGINNSLNNINDKSLDQIKKDISVSNNKNNDIHAKSFFIGACGLSNFYILELKNNKINLVKKINYRIDYLYFKQIMIFIHDKCIYGFKNHNDIEIYEKPKIQTFYQSSTLNEKHEEYFYTIKENKNKITFHREDDSIDVPEDWLSFFIIGDKIYKVLKKDEMYCFVFHNKLYKYKDEICDIHYIKKYDELVFFTRGENMKVIFIRREFEKEIEIPMITALNVDEDRVSAANGDGKVFVFNERRDYCIKNVYNLPITSCGLGREFVYFSSFNGLIDRKRIGNGKFIYYFIALIILIISFFIYLIK
ncbi:hypothetical protein COBT_000692 [Conglomerata obtusa]